jgi:hypothetical protein
MSRASYQIFDEPATTGLNAFAVHPNYPLLCTMLAGAWAGLPWFCVNALALGSPTARREITLAVAAGAGAVALTLLLLWAGRAGLIPEAAMPYLLLVNVAWKLGAGYVLVGLQSRTFHLYEYYGGQVKNGWAVLMVAMALRNVVRGVFDHPLWTALVG